MRSLSQEAVHHTESRKHEKVIHRNRRIMPVQLISMTEIAILQKLHMAQDNQEDHDATEAFQRLNAFIGSQKTSSLILNHLLSNDSLPHSLQLQYHSIGTRLYCIAVLIDPVHHRRLQIADA